jgi:hypothetical protein
MEQKNDQEILEAISSCVKDHIQNKMNLKLSALSGGIGVSHPTAAKILYPTEKEGSGGVAIKHWFSALGYCDLLDPFIKELEGKARDWHRPLETLNPKCADEAIHKLIHLTQSFNREKSLKVNNISCILDVSFNTAKAMTHVGENSTGVAIKSWIKLLGTMKLTDDICKIFERKNENTVNKTTNPQLTFDRRTNDLIY